MSIIGLDFGSHCASFAVYRPKTGVCEVLADDLGSRAVPCVVAFRGKEVIIGQSALSQQYKNRKNTFDNLYEMLLLDNEMIYISELNKDMNIIDLISYFFRHIYDQVSQQIGQVVKDTIVSVHSSLMNNEVFKERFVSAARAGGLRIKSFIPNTVAPLLAHCLDSLSTNEIGSNCSKRNVVVIDLGYSQTSVATYDVSGGLITPQESQVSFDCCGSTIVNALTKHCTKDFRRKTKVTCDDNQRAMLRLRKETEGGVRILSTSQETMIDIDALAEGMDYSCKISRAKFEDLSLLYFMGVKNLVKSLEVDPAIITDVILCGGFSTVPKTVADLKWLFPNANFLRSQVEPSETICLGAALHGMTLAKEGVLDSAPSTSESIPVLPVSLYLNDQVIFSEGLVLPLATVIPAMASTKENTGLKLSSGDIEVAQVVIPKDKLEATEDTTEVTVTISVSVDGAIDVVAKQVQTGAVVSELNIPSTSS